MSITIKRSHVLLLFGLGLLVALFALEPDLAQASVDVTKQSSDDGGLGSGLADQLGNILKPLLLICAGIMGFGAMLKGDWKTLGGCILMLLIVGSFFYGQAAWKDQIEQFSSALGK